MPFQGNHAADMKTMLQAWKSCRRHSGHAAGMETMPKAKGMGTMSKPNRDKETERKRETERDRERQRET